MNSPGVYAGEPMPLGLDSPVHGAFSPAVTVACGIAIRVDAFRRTNRWQYPAAAYLRQREVP